MNKRLIKRIILSVFLIAFVAFSFSYLESQTSFISLLYYELFVHDQGHEPNPNLLIDYPESRTGYYQFDPKTILVFLMQGKEVFTPLSLDAIDTDAYNAGIEWTQSDFFYVADALSQRVWNEPLDLNNWDVYFFLSDGICKDNFGGFDDFQITYYKTIKTGWETVYTARRIEVSPRIGVVKWAGNGDFSVNFFQGWRKIELKKFQATVEQAVRIAEKYRKEVVGLNNCRVLASIVDDRHSSNKYEWEISYSNSTTQFSVFIDPLYGKVNLTK